MLSGPTRRIVKIVHIVAGVAVLGDVWGLALMHLDALRSGSLAVGRTAFGFTTLMVFAGGVPFSLISLVSGLVLALFGGWGLRHGWVLAKLVLQLGILLTGGLFIAPVLRGAPSATDLTGSHRTFLVLLLVQGVMLLTATVLAVVKPGRRALRRTAPSPP
ncbi:DUF2269 family protein [Actinopolymorpha pittospori]|uniref:Membrane protein n=1 Tax=Actinopolymorpha pittospori TaxID=648752 RepID=A0A927RCT7_9ACTN|nr:DUF2269 family protein [Actinopolymorpha pittospori]MBE1607410.1 putative membrane protein [Actinopolymorpha pittospori]